MKKTQIAGLDMSSLAPSSPSNESLPDTCQTHSPVSNDEVLMSFVRTFEHSCGCQQDECNTINCREMKKHVNHAGSCEIKTQGGCRVCKRIWKLRRCHAQIYQDSDGCSVPHCSIIKSRLYRWPQGHIQTGDNSQAAPSTTIASVGNSPNRRKTQFENAVWYSRLKLVEHPSKCQKSKDDCSFSGCAHVKKCRLRRRVRPGLGFYGGGCRACQIIWASLENGTMFSESTLICLPTQEQVKPR